MGAAQTPSMYGHMPPSLAALTKIRPVYRMDFGTMMLEIQTGQFSVRSNLRLTRFFAATLTLTWRAMAMAMIRVMPIARRANRWRMANSCTDSLKDAVNE